MWLKIDPTRQLIPETTLQAWVAGTPAPEML